ncbi:hypothetical protein [Aliterella atlantica]|uniref:Uncharacterized protein n=1 Tax=Aliterella atlantica CENA595 TaxID=1618023 RepID=A0A0D8ZND1_9CYAN|nr:hypothetical protein [Aliterella atlantica]KJH69989.1 hypothetical protein UH38_20900 [Aliterella atlantica CENA595]
MANNNEPLTFESAIALSQSLLLQVDSGKLSEAEIGSQIAELVKTENGARGFFVTFLTSNSSLADNPTDAVIQALRSSPEEVAELLVKNLAMSTAQELFHHRRQAEEMVHGSQQVQMRTANLIKLVDLDEVKERSQQLIDSATTGEGKYKAFLERWNYDAEQKQLICAALQQVTLP